MPIQRDKKRYSFGYSTCLQRDKFIKLFKETQESLLADCEIRLFNRKWEPQLLKKPMTEKEHDYLPEWYEKPSEVDWMDLAEDDKGFVFRIRQLYSLEKRFEEIFGFVMLTGLDTADHIWSYKKRMKEKEFKNVLRKQVQKRLLLLWNLTRLLGKNHSAKNKNFLKNVRKRLLLLRKLRRQRQLTRLLQKRTITPSL
jgi:hypothetical protein